MLIQKERVKTIIKSVDERGLVVGLVAQVGNKARGRGESVVTCSKSSKNVHDVKKVFSNSGLP